MTDWENQIAENHTTDYSQNLTMFSPWSINQSYIEMRETLHKDILKK